MQKSQTIWPTEAISGPLILLMWLFTLINTVTSLGLTGIATLLAWTYVAIELPRLTPKQRKQILTLLSVGIATALLASSQGSDITLQQLFGEHLKLAMLLTAVSFIGMATRVASNKSRIGIPSFVTTLLGMHLFSSVANFSAVIVVGEQVKRSGRIDQLSQFILSRGFGMAVLWSPFLSILPLVLEQVEGTRLQQIYPFSITLAIIGLLLTLLESRFRAPDQLNNYAGYPLKSSTLALPLSLIGMILLLSWQQPQLPTIFLVSLLAAVVPVLLVVLRSGPTGAGLCLITHVTEKLAQSRAEISLFLSAGLLAAGVKACIGVGLISLPFTETNAAVASLAMVLIVTFAYLGIHQLALVAIFAGLLADITTTPNLMAVGYILGTALAMTGSTFSGLNFMMKARFNCEDREIIRNHLPFNLTMLTIGCGLIFTMEYLGIQ
ncbi:hypothetical protein [Amphritea sp. HPY]|uniref:hypothetical protein n=1 Tax=Amphritea sp. HPY TaxID=3421652 RepID=UPI003D7C4BFC